MFIEKIKKNVVLSNNSSPKVPTGYNAPYDGAESFYIENKINSIIIKRENSLQLLKNPFLFTEGRQSLTEGTFGNKDYLELKKKPYLSYIESILQKQTNNNIALYCYGVNDSIKTASNIGILIAKKLENKIRFPKIKRELFDQIQQSSFIEGIRISCSGSLKGGLMAKTYTYKLGATSLQVFSKKIDYHFCHALTKYGSLGIKVWVAYK